MEWIQIPKVPDKKGKYVVRCITPHNNINVFLTMFNGKSFDVNNQKVIEWLKE